MSVYPPPLDQLLALGQPAPDAWLDYRTLGLGPEHTPSLLRMAGDPALNQGDPETPDVYGPVHAWRALGQVGTADLVPQLLDLLEQCEDEIDDWLVSDFPRLLAGFGPAALPALAAFVGDPARGPMSRGTAGEAIEKLGQAHPDQREACVTALARPLADSEQFDRGANGWFLASLLALKAVESAPAIEAAFAAGRIDESVAGNWPEVRYELGLGPPPPRRPRPWRAAPSGPDPRQRAEQRKAERKRAKKARKRDHKRPR